MDQVTDNPQDNVTLPRELLLKIEESLESRCGTNAPERREILPQLRELLEQPAVEPSDNDRVMTVVYYDPTKEDVQAFMDHPKAQWFGWCHAPYQRDEARFRLEQLTAPQAQQPRKAVKLSDTATRLMELADSYANSFNQFVPQAEQCRQSLQDEITRLFTPLSDEQISDLISNTSKTGPDRVNGITGENK